MKSVCVFRFILSGPIITREGMTVFQIYPRKQATAEKNKPLHIDICPIIEKVSKILCALHFSKTDRPVIKVETTLLHPHVEIYQYG